MPKIYEYFGFIFYFYSNEHEPIHVHVIKDDAETIFEIILRKGEFQEIKQRNKRGTALLNSKDSKTAEYFIFKYKDNIIEKWTNYFLFKKEIRCTKIRKKI